MKSILERQRKFFNSNATKDLDFRIQQLKKLERLLLDNTKLLNEAIYKDIKKSAFETYSNEFSVVHQELDDAIKNLKRWASTKSAGTNLANFPAKSYIQPEPLGVSLVIAAWNYPYQLSLAPAVAAIAAGCTVVLKPSELPVNTSSALASLINTNFDPEFFTVVEGGVRETAALLEQHFDKIFFTGSPRVGRIVMKAAAEHLTPVTLELGGKSPAFFTEGCNLKMGIKRLIWAKYINAGQTCIAPDHVLIHHSLKNEFLKLAKAEIEKARYSFENGNYVQIIDQKNVHRLAKMLDPNKVYLGGEFDLESRWFAPTLVTDVTYDDAIMQEEIFGPILPVLEYTELGQAIAKVKEGHKPLSCYVFTKSNKTKRRILNELSFGGGCINDSIMHISNGHLPFGGVGESGTGSYHGEAGFKAFSHYKSILDKPTWFELNLKYSPYSSSKLNWIKRIM